jgi:hypothetical protein
MTDTRTYVKHITIKYEKFGDVDSIIDDLIAAETNTGAVFKTINSSIDGGSALFILVFERAS